MNLLKKILSLVLVSQFILPWAAMAKEKNHYESKKCGEFIIISNTHSNAQISVCRNDNGVMDDGNKTPEGITQIVAPEAIVEGARNSSKIIDEILLKEVKERAEKKLEGFKTITDLPDNKDTKELKEQVAAFKKLILESKKGAIHQIRTILSVYPEIEDELITDHPEYKTLLCKYEVWKHRREILEKVTKISAKIVSILLVLGTAGTVVAFFGLFSIAMMGPIMMALGATEVGIGGLQIFSSIENWDDVRAGGIAKKLLKFDKELHDYIVLLQKSPEKNKKEILELQKLTLSSNDIKDLKNLKKVKNKRIKELIGGGIKMVLGTATFIGGAALKERFSDFHTNDPAIITNQGGNGTLPGSGGNDPVDPGGDGPGGFPTDDGG